MNSSSIVMAFIFSGVLSIMIHNIAIGPIVLGPSQLVVSQVSTDNNSTDMLRPLN